MGWFPTALLSLVLQAEGSSRYVGPSNQLSDGLMDYFNPTRIISVIFSQPLNGLRFILITGKEIIFLFNFLVSRLFFFLNRSLKFDKKDLLPNLFYPPMS